MSDEWNAFTYHLSPMTYHALFVEFLNKRGANARQERSAAAARVWGQRRRRSCRMSDETSARRLELVLLLSLLDQLAERDGEVARGAFQTVGRSVQLVNAAGVPARGDRGERVGDLRVQALGCR